MDTFIATLPFSGFYCTQHSWALDDVVERMFINEDGIDNISLINRVSSDCDWPEVYKAYAKEYAENFMKEMKINGEFESMKSPKEYNFETDRIFIKLELKEIFALHARLDTEAFANLAKEAFTSRSGFLSYYSPDVSEWGTVETWDHNQLGLMLIHIAEQHFGEDHDYEMYLMDWAMANGKLETWIQSNTSTFRRLSQIFDYLNKREKRG